MQRHYRSSTPSNPCIPSVTARRGAPEQADGHYRAALVLADQLAMRPLVAHCHLGLGTLYRQMDDRATADEHLGIATTTYREMDTTFWLEKAAAELGGVER